MGNEHFLCCWVDSPPPSPPPPYRLPHLQGFSQTVHLGEGVKQSIHGWGNKQDESGWKIFGKMGNTGGLNQEDNSAGQLSRFWTLSGWGLSEAIEKRNFMTKTLFQITMLNEVLKGQK